VNHYRLVVQRPGKFRVEVRPTESGKAELVCVSDGKTLTRLLTAKGLYTKVKAADPLAELPRCALTAMSLQGSGLDILTRPDAVTYVLGQVARVEDRGAAAFEGGKAHHFKLLLGRREVELWFTEGPVPLLRRFVRTLEVPVGDKDKFKLITVADLKWQVGGDAPEGAFTVTLPEGARQVDDLHEALVKGTTETLLGRPAPAVALKALDGGAYRLDPAKAREAAVLIFWATWSAPSTEKLPAIRTFVEEYGKKGVAFYAINVGEQAEAVKAFAAKAKVASTLLLDAEGKATEAYGVTALPAVVVIDRDGTVRSVHRGSGEAVRAALRRELDALLKGKTLEK
jgi:peroxiredoxin